MAVPIVACNKSILLNIAKFLSNQYFAQHKRIMARRERFNANCANRTKKAKHHRQKNKRTTHRKHKINFAFEFNFSLLLLVLSLWCFQRVWIRRLLGLCVKLFYFSTLFCSFFSVVYFLTSLSRSSLVVRVCFFARFDLLLLLLNAYFSYTYIQLIFVFDLKFFASPLHTHHLIRSMYWLLYYVYVRVDIPAVCMWFSTWALCSSVKIFAQKTLKR